MVFQARKRRDRTQQQKKATKAITDLPDELLLDILELTPNTSDVLKLRETCKGLVPICTSIIRERLKVLYIHPSPSSVRRAINICQSDLSSGIQEVCLVNKVLWPEIRRHSRGDFECTWPSGIPKRIHGNSTTGFDDEYSELLSSLAKLSQVQTLSFTDACYQAGFNMISAQSVRNWMETVQHSSPSIGRRAESMLYTSKSDNTCSPRFKYTDSVVLDSLFRNLFTNRLRCLKLTEELPWANCVSLSALSSTLTQVELHANTGWPHSMWETFCHIIVSFSAPTLQELKLAFQHNPAFMRRPQVDNTLDRILRDLKLPELQRLELCALEPKVTRANTRRLLFQHFDLGIFVSERCEKLEKLRLDHVIPMPRSRHAQWKALDEMLLDTNRKIRAIGEPCGDMREFEIKPSGTI